MIPAQQPSHHWREQLTMRFYIRDRGELTLHIVPAHEAVGLLENVKFESLITHENGFLPIYQKMYP